MRVLSLVLLLLLAASLSQGRELQQHQARFRTARQRTTTTAEDEALAIAAAAAADAAAAATITDAAATIDGADTEAAATTAAAAVRLAAAAAACPSPQFEWPAGSGYCWYKRDSGGATAGPGGNVFAPGNVVVNAQDQLVLAIVNPNKISKSSCAEVFTNRSLGYGDYVFVVATNPMTIDQRLVGAPFIYDTDTKEYDFEFTTWNVAPSNSPNNSQVCVQPYTTNKPVTWRLNAVNTTHRIRWTNESVVFESFYSDAAGGGRMFTWTYKGPNNFVPLTERVHINYWINTRVNAVPNGTTFVTNCFKFCPAASLDTCSSPLGTKPRCSATRTW